MHFSDRAPKRDAGLTEISSGAMLVRNFDCGHWQNLQFFNRRIAASGTFASAPDLYVDALRLLLAYS
jgi:hypothetical protein